MSYLRPPLWYLSVVKPSPLPSPSPSHVGRHPLPSLVAWSLENRLRSRTSPKVLPSLLWPLMPHKLYTALSSPPSTFFRRRLIASHRIARQGDRPPRSTTARILPRIRPQIELPRSTLPSHPTNTHNGTHQSTPHAHPTIFTHRTPADPDASYLSDQYILHTANNFQAPPTKGRNRSQSSRWTS